MRTGWWWHQQPPHSSCGSYAMLHALLPPTWILLRNFMQGLLLSACVWWEICSDSRLAQRLVTLGYRRYRRSSACRLLPMCVLDKVLMPSCTIIRYYRMGWPLHVPELSGGNSSVGAVWPKLWLSLLTGVCGLASIATCIVQPTR